MKKRRVRAIFLVALLCISSVFAVPVFADGTYSWGQKANHSSANVMFAGSVNWMDEGIFPNLVAYNALLGGNEACLFTDTNGAHLVISSGICNNILVSKKVYYGHSVRATQFRTTASSIKIKWFFDGYSGYKCLDLKAGSAI